jgi:hypothetical protein
MRVLQPVMIKSWANNRNEKIKIKNLFLHPQKEVYQDFSGYLDYYRSTIVTRTSTHNEAPKNLLGGF